jgi:hypothetical protein
MASPSDLVSGKRSSDDLVLYAGHFAEDASSVDSQLEVVIDAFDPDIKWGPAPWMPRITDGGSTVIPEEGDRCVVGLAESEIAGTAEVWVLAWWPNG